MLVLVEMDGFNIEADVYIEPRDPGVGIMTDDYSVENLDLDGVVDLVAFEKAYGMEATTENIERVIHDNRADIEKRAIAEARTILNEHRLGI